VIEGLINDLKPTRLCKQRIGEDIGISDRLRL
jgi:hypothetical protein